MAYTESLEIAKKKKIENGKIKLGEDEGYKDHIIRARIRLREGAA